MVMVMVIGEVIWIRIGYCRHSRHERPELPVKIITFLSTVRITVSGRTGWNPQKIEIDVIQRIILH